jgi:hypothetical protein
MTGVGLGRVMRGGLRVGRREAGRKREQGDMREISTVNWRRISDMRNPSALHMTISDGLLPDV